VTAADHLAFVSTPSVDSGPPRRRGEVGNVAVTRAADANEAM
jgi:hypothetical protein